MQMFITKNHEWISIDGDVDNRSFPVGEGAEQSEAEGIVFFQANAPFHGNVLCLTKYNPFRHDRRLHPFRSGRRVREPGTVLGYVTSVDSRRGITVKLRGLRDGEVQMLPPDTGSWTRVKAGHYTLRSTGEVVIDPDYTSSWSVTKPKN